MFDSSLTFVHGERSRRMAPSAIRSARIVVAADGFKLLAVLPGSASEWTLTSPGGIADTFPSLSGLEAFARVVLADKPLSLPL
ncbi:hypothetical protein [uncultured Variovorax sp.]|jgi:hypothetical protein|uniref:hypothetical protein n=1 Tax=uncultured Variovorax sp. TaxID=114708 RepID=UPI002623CBBA|nr:hypothetical protein [uncultured Variovorax sp.]